MLGGGVKDAACEVGAFYTHFVIKFIIIKSA